MKKSFKNITAFILIISMLFVFTSCGGDTTLAKIKDNEVTQEQLDGYVNFYSLLSLSTSSKELGEEELAYLKRIILGFAVEVEVLKKHYEDADEGVLPDDYDDQFAEYKQNLFAQGEGIEERLSEEGIGNDTLEFFFNAQFYTKRFMDDIDKEDPVTDDQIETYYNDNKDTLSSPAQIRARHILVQDDQLSEEGRTSIEAIKTKIENGDATFEEMAEEYNSDATAEVGGDLGWFSQDGSMVKEFEDAAFALEEKGDMSDVVETQFGYHLILLTDKKAEHQKTLKEARDEIKHILEEQRYQEGIESLKNEIGVEYTDAGKEIMGMDENTDTEDGTVGGAGEETPDQ